LRTASMLIYFLHMFINVGVGILKKALYKFLNVDIQMFQFFISLTATLIVAFIIEYASRKEKFKWLRWLIT